MKKTAIGLCALITFITVGERPEPQPRGETLALEIVKSGFEDRPIVPADIARQRSFRAFGCPEVLLELQRQRIGNGEVKPWFEVHG